MIYFDTSALAKKYLKKEKGRGRTLELLEADPQGLVSSALTHLEVISALTRRQKEIAGFGKAVEAFQDDWEAFIVWSIDGDVINDAVALVVKHRLKAADAIHLATALSIRSHVKDRLVLVSSDRELLAAAKNEGLLAIDPETET